MYIPHQLILYKTKYYVHELKKSQLHGVKSKQFIFNYRKSMDNKSQYHIEKRNLNYVTKVVYHTNLSNSFTEKQFFWIFSSLSTNRCFEFKLLDKDINRIA